MTDQAAAARAIADGLTEAQRRWFERQMIRIGNPVRLAPSLHPIAQRRTWGALERLGIIERGRFGVMLTPLGEQLCPILKQGTHHDD